MFKKELRPNSRFSNNKIKGYFGSKKESNAVPYTGCNMKDFLLQGTDKIKLTHCSPSFSQVRKSLKIN